MLSSIKKRKIEREADDTPDIVKKHQKESNKGKGKRTSEGTDTTKLASEVSSPPQPEMSTGLDVQDDAEAEEEVAPKSFKDLV